MKASSPYKGDISLKMPKLATKPYAITPAERVKTIHHKVKKGHDFMYGKGLNDIFSKKDFHILIAFLKPGKLYCKANKLQ